MSAETASSAALASAERIAQLKRLQRRVGGLRSTLPVSTTDDAPATDPSSSYRGTYEHEYGTYAVDRSGQERERSRQSGHDQVDTKTSNGADSNIRIAAAIGSLLSYIRSTETSPDAFIDPSYFQNGSQEWKLIEALISNVTELKKRDLLAKETVQQAMQNLDHQARTIDTLNQECAVLQRRLEHGEQSGEAEAARAEAQRLRAELQACSADLAVLRALQDKAGPGARDPAVEELMRQRDAAVAELRRLQDGTALENAAHKDLTAELAALRADNGRLQEALRAQQAALGDSAASRSAEETRLRAELDRILNASGGAAARAAEAEKQAEELRALLHEKTREMEGLKEANRRLEAERGRLARELEEATNVFNDVEPKYKELRSKIESVKRERDSMEDLMAELERLREEKSNRDALIAEMNEQIHQMDAHRTAVSFHQHQQLQRNVQELQDAVAERDRVIAQLQAGGDVRNHDPRQEAEVKEQEIRLIAEHQYEIQQQLQAIQGALTQQQLLLTRQSEEAARSGHYQSQMAAHAAQLAALQNSLAFLAPSDGGAGGAPRTGPAVISAPLGAGSFGGAGAGGPAGQGGSGRLPAPGGMAASAGSFGMPSGTVVAQGQGADRATELAMTAAEKARRSAAAAAAVARRTSGLSVSAKAELDC